MNLLQIQSRRLCVDFNITPTEILADGLIVLDPRFLKSTQNIIDDLENEVGVHETTIYGLKRDLNNSENDVSSLERTVATLRAELEEKSLDTDAETQ